MPSDSDVTFTKENLDTYLSEVARKYRKICGKKTPAEMILIGDASILVNYGFRESTTDIDAIIQAASGMKEAIKYVEDKYGLPVGWLNADFINTTSYTPKLSQFSKYYRTFSNVLVIRTVSGEYLIAMKLMSGRKYKHDLSDIVGILNDESFAGNHIDLDMIKKAAEDLYGSWEAIPKDSRDYLYDVLNSEDYEGLMRSVAEEEESAKAAILEFRNDNPEESKGKTANDIIDMLKNL